MFILFWDYGAIRVSMGWCILQVAIEKSFEGMKEFNQAIMIVLPPPRFLNWALELQIQNLPCRMQHLLDRLGSRKNTYLMLILSLYYTCIRAWKIIIRSKATSEKCEQEILKN